MFYHSERSHLTELYLQINLQKNEIVCILICNKSNSLAATAINFYVINLWDGKHFSLYVIDYEYVIN